MTEERIKELCGKAGLRKPFMYTSFIWMQALGKSKSEAGQEIGVSPRTLTRWEAKVFDNLGSEERMELVEKAVNYEYRERVGEQSE